MLDGLSVLQRWRQDGRTMPVLILTARGTWREKVMGLRAGADDYLAKPFEMEEMLARVEALIRRAAGHSSPVLDCGPLRLDTTAHRLTMSGALVELTALEFRLISYLLHHPGKVVSKSELSEHIYGYDEDRDSNTIEVLINRLRRKLAPELIRTHRGQGYQLIDPHHADRTLTLRLIAASAIWVLGTLCAAGLLLLLLFQDHIERRFDAALADHLQELAAASEVGADGTLQLSWTPFDPRFNRPQSGLVLADRAGRGGRRALAVAVARAPERRPGQR